MIETQHVKFKVKDAPGLKRDMTVIQCKGFITSGEYNNIVIRIVLPDLHVRRSHDDCYEYMLL